VTDIIELSSEEKDTWKCVDTVELQTDLISNPEPGAKAQAQSWPDPDNYI